MKKLILFVTLLSFNLAMSEECPPNAAIKGHNQFDKLAKEVSKIASATSDDPVVQINSAALYLSSIGRNEIATSEAEKFISALSPLCNSKELSSRIRSQACLKLAGVNGKMAQKLQLSGTSYGKAAFKNIKDSLVIDPENKEAVSSYAMAVVGVLNQNFFIRKAVESSLNVKINEEAQFAMKNLERVNLTETDIYRSLKEKIN